MIAKSLDRIEQSAPAGVPKVYTGTCSLPHPPIPETGTGGLDNPQKNVRSAYLSVTWLN